MLDIAIKERRRLRIKEQLEDFYSLLMAQIEYFDRQTAHATPNSIMRNLMNNLKSKYEFLAEPDLKDALRDYYKTDLGTLSTEDFELFITPIRDAILEDFYTLSIEYSSLTKPSN